MDRNGRPTSPKATYRTLIYFRSRNPRQPWLLALPAMLDAAALHLAALCPQSAPGGARPLHLPAGDRRGAGGRISDDPRPDDPLALAREEFDTAVEHLAGNVERTPDEAWPHFCGWRVNYETAAANIAAHLDLVPAPWPGARARLGAAEARPDRPVDREPEAA